MSEPATIPDAVVARAWSLVIPVKPAAVGKSRLSVPGVEREALARAIALDTVEAAARAARTAEVVVVTDDDGVRAALTEGAIATMRLVADPGRGLNAAIAAGLEAASAPLRAALLGDLPALRAADLDAALGAASTGAAPDAEGSAGDGTGAAAPTRQTVEDPPGIEGIAIDRPAPTDAGRPTPRAVADADGTGTTLLAHAHPDALCFGADSYARHLAAGAVPLDVGSSSSVRQDVDTAAHLAAARQLGLGPRTAALVSRGTAGGVRLGA